MPGLDGVGRSRRDGRCGPGATIVWVNWEMPGFGTKRHGLQASAWAHRSGPASGHRPRDFDTLNAAVCLDRLQGPRHGWRVLLRLGELSAPATGRRRLVRSRLSRVVEGAALRQPGAMARSLDRQRLPRQHVDCRRRGVRGLARFSRHNSPSSGLWTSCPSPCARSPAVATAVDPRLSGQDSSCWLGPIERSADCRVIEPISEPVQRTGLPHHVRGHVAYIMTPNLYAPGGSMSRPDSALVLAGHDTVTRTGLSWCQHPDFILVT